VFGCKQPAGDKSTGNNKFKEGPAAAVAKLRQFGSFMI
jgi:hypothetical protein